MLPLQEFKQEVESSFTGIFPPHAEELYTAVTSQLATRSNKQPGTDPHNTATQSETILYIVSVISKNLFQNIFL